MGELTAWLDRFIEADAKISALTALRGEKARLDRQRQPRCGNCYWWMKSNSCPREWNDRGMCRGPSCDDMPCSKFQIKPRHEKWLIEKQAELDRRLDEINA